MVNPKATKLDAEKSDVFHTTISKELFLCERTRPNIQPVVPFLCTRVKVPDEEDWTFLLIMIKDLQETRDEKLTLNINNITMADWYSYAGFAVHVDTKSHRGCINHG